MRVRWIAAIPISGRSWTRNRSTYTTVPLQADLEVTGHPVAHLWVTSNTEDADFIVYLEEVHPDGHSQYVTEGKLRASHRKLSEPPYDFLGLPWHRSFEADVMPLPEGPVELVFDLLPTSNLFDAGNRIRVTVSGADDDSVNVLRFTPPPVLTVYREPERASRIVLPVIPASYRKGPDTGQSL